MYNSGIDTHTCTFLGRGYHLACCYAGVPLSDHDHFVPSPEDYFGWPINSFLNKSRSLPHHIKRRYLVLRCDVSTVRCVSMSILVVVDDEEPVHAWPRVHPHLCLLAACSFAYQPPTSSAFLSEQTSHQQSASSTFLSEQISISHQPPAKRTGYRPHHEWQGTQSEQRDPPAAGRTYKRRSGPKDKDAKDSSQKKKLR
jgi:hypothetical protein